MEYEVKIREIHAGDDHRDSRGSLRPKHPVGQRGGQEQGPGRIRIRQAREAIQVAEGDRREEQVLQEVLLQDQERGLRQVLLPIDVRPVQGLRRLQEQLQRHVPRVHQGAGLPEDQEIPIRVQRLPQEGEVQALQIRL